MSARVAAHAAPAAQTLPLDLRTTPRPQLLGLHALWLGNALEKATFASYLAMGVVTCSMWPQVTLVAPALLVPVLVGARLYTGISLAGVKRVVLALLSCTGVALLLRSVPAVWARLA